MKAVLYGILLSGFCLVLVGCDLFGGRDDDKDDDDDSASTETTITEVRIDPNPAEVGRIVQITAVLEDSLDSSYTFHWMINSATLNTSERQVSWRAPDVPGMIGGFVSATNGRRHANKLFSFPVVD